MKTKNIKRVPDCFVGEDCIQHTFDYKNKIALISLDDVIYKDFKDGNKIINSYLNDDRRKQFPYGNIPAFTGKKGLFGKINYVNELIDFDKKYVCIKPGIVKTLTAIKVNDSAYLIEGKVSMTDEIEDRIITKQDLFTYCINDIFLSLNSDIISYGINIRPNHEIDDNDKLIKASNVIQIHKNNDKLELFLVNVKYMDSDVFIMKKQKLKDDIDISLLSYISTYIKCHGKSFNYDVGEIKQPDINLKCNPNITPFEIEEAKRFIKKNVG